MKELALQEINRAAGNFIPGDGHADRCEMNADLVSTTGLGQGEDESKMPRLSELQISSACRPPVRNDGHSLSMVRVARDRRVDDTSLLAQSPF